MVVPVGSLPSDRLGYTAGIKVQIKILSFADFDGGSSGWLRWRTEEQTGDVRVCPILCGFRHPPADSKLLFGENNATDVTTTQAQQSSGPRHNRVSIIKAMIASSHSGAKLRS